MGLVYLTHKGQRSIVFLTEFAHHDPRQAKKKIWACTPQNSVRFLPILEGAGPKKFWRSEVMAGKVCEKSLTFDLSPYRSNKPSPKCQFGTCKFKLRSLIYLIFWLEHMESVCACVCVSRKHWIRGKSDQVCCANACRNWNYFGILGGGV